MAKNLRERTEELKEEKEAREEAEKKAKELEELLARYRDRFGDLPENLWLKPSPQKN